MATGGGCRIGGGAARGGATGTGGAVATGGATIAGGGTVIGGSGSGGGSGSARTGRWTATGAMGSVRIATGAGGVLTIGTSGGMSAAGTAAAPGMRIGTRSPARAAPIAQKASAAVINLLLAVRRRDGRRGCATIAPSVPRSRNRRALATDRREGLGGEPGQSRIGVTRSPIEGLSGRGGLSPDLSEGP